MANQPEYTFTFHPDADGLEKFMGNLEAQIMEILWANEPMTVKRCLYFLSKDRKPAYTTVMTVMNRLAAKKIINRKKESNAFIYSPNFTKKEFLTKSLDRIFAGLLKDFKKETADAFYRHKKSSPSKSKSLPKKKRS